MPKNTLILIFLLQFSFFKISGLTTSLYIPVTIHSPLFKKDTDKEIQAGSFINNYGLHLHFARQLKRRIIIFSVQQNDGNIKFDPLHFNKYRSQGQEFHWIQSYPTKMFYCEIGTGLILNSKSKKLSLITGIGHEFQNKNTRFFIQFEIGNESRIMNAGASIRANYTSFNNSSFFALEPAVQGKLKIGKLRMVNQFGYSIAIKKHHDYMKPVLTVGIEIVL
jgi:hypothetical protein